MREERDLGFALFIAAVCLARLRRSRRGSGVLRLQLSAEAVLRLAAALPASEISGSSISMVDAG
jgi:hypothetical protein